MTAFFHLIGRLGNLMFVYAHARAYCEREGLDLCLPTNVLEKIFDIPEAVRPPKNGLPDRVIPEQTFQNQDAMIYTRKQVLEWFRIKPNLLEEMSVLLQDRKPVILNLRNGQDLIGTGIPILNAECYAYGAQQYGYKLEDCEWETDTKPTSLPYFQGDITASGLNTTWVALPSFYRLMTAKVLFRSNSTFAWWSSTLGNGKVYSPLVKEAKNGYARFTEGNWPVMAPNHPNTDLHLAE